MTIFLLTFFPLALAALVFFFRYREKKMAAQLRKSQEENKRLAQQVATLESSKAKFKLNPHLFKNTLNTVQGYAFRTHQSLEKLGGVLDYLLYDSEAQFISVKEEIEFSRNFIDLNKIKLSPLYDLKIRYDIDESSVYYNEPVIVPLLTAHFIESVFRHADMQSDDAFIAIETRLTGNEFYFQTTNKISETPVVYSKGGLGKTTLKSQMEEVYGSACVLEYVTHDDVYISTLKINLLEFKTKMRDRR